MKVFLARIGWMAEYKGVTSDDTKPSGGGKYNKGDTGSEYLNFFDVEGEVYGYVNPNSISENPMINLSRIDKNATGDRVHDVLVIWFAPSPDKQPVVVGWYNHATVYRERQARPNDDGSFYYMTAETKNAVLIPSDRRSYIVGHQFPGEKRGQPGQSNAFYFLDENGEQKDNQTSLGQWMPKLIEYVKNYTDEFPENSFEIEIENQVKNDALSFQNDVNIRSMIENYAMERCREYYLSQGYKVEDKSKFESYDFFVSKNGSELKVEVKGLQSSDTKIFLTKNEVELSAKEGANMSLYILSGIIVEMDKNGNGNIKKGSGKQFINHPWIVDRERLTPIAFSYEI